MADGHIYFARIKSIRHGYLFKVGFSTNPNWRVRCLGTAKNPAELIDYFPGTMDEELAIHATLDGYRIVGEWYRAGRRVYRIMLYCMDHRSVPPPIVHLANCRALVKSAKRAATSALVDASSFLSDSENFDFPAESDPFPMYRKNRTDFDWLDDIRNRCRMRGLAKHEGNT